MDDAIIKGFQLTKDQKDVIRMLYRMCQFMIDHPDTYEEEKPRYVGKRQMLEQLFGNDFLHNLEEKRN